MEVAEVLPLHNMDVQEVYEAFLSEHYRNSERTAGEYKSRVEEFFMLTLGKEMKFVTVDDIKSVKNKDVQTKFVDVLIERGNTAGTIKTKLHSVSSFYNALLKNEVSVNPRALDIKLKKSTKHHEALSLQEYLNLLEFMKEESDGLEKYLYSKTLFHTGGRKTATLYFSWDKITQKKDIGTGQMVWVIDFVGKGSKDTERPISDEFYNELKQLDNGQENVFSMLSSSEGAYKRYERSLKKYAKMIGKNISIHTMKATAITIGYQLTKDINLCKQLGAHSSMATTEIYIKEEKSYVNQLSYNMSRDIDESILDELSHEELLSFIKDNEDIKMSILMRLGR
ncbi:hypothetical protein BAGA_05355 [Bacillus gaemokensis]|uniref:Integrase n=1 Tax=Bacillus gaemokensis TaxID=574375 RepID=A0A073KBI6_9BACI|nr:hypothetical protein BAGA_05355 [Bacillus gaemokensis]